MLVALVATTALSFVPGVAAAQERPDFQLPFPCGQTWRIDTWAHAPALDMVREPNQVGTEGATLVAPAAGTVVESFRHSNAGETIQIDHGGGWFTTYLHLEARSVSTGDEVDQGDEIGQVGRTGPTSNDHPHLHFELAVDENGDGSASWGFAGSERVRPWFDGVEYGQSNGRTWRDVESRNCGEAAPASSTTVPETTTTEAPATTVAPTTTTAAVIPATVVSTVPTTTVVVPATTEVDATEAASAAGETLPRTGTSTTTVAAAVAAALLAVGAVLVLVRRHATR